MQTRPIRTPPQNYIAVFCPTNQKSVAEESQRRDRARMLPDQRAQIFFRSNVKKADHFIVAADG